MKILLLLFSLFVAEISYAQCGKNINEGIQKIIDEYHIKYNIPGIQASVICPGEKEPRDFVSGNITMDGTIPVQTDNLFQIGSETKSFVAVLLLKLEAKGLLSIDDTIDKWFPQVPQAWQKVTVKQLLNHTSGIFDYSDVDDFINIATNDYQRQWLDDELINLSFNHPMYFEPGKGYHYSNTNYILAGMIIKAVTGHSVEEEMNQTVLPSLQLSNTYYMPRPYSDEIRQRMAHGYGTEKPNTPYYDATELNMSLVGSAGAFISTTHDTALWLKKLIAIKSVLPAKQQQELMSLVDVKNGQPISENAMKEGYGFAIQHNFLSNSRNGEMWYHSGSTFGYQSKMIWLKCNDIIVTMNVNIYRHETRIHPLIDNLALYLQQMDESDRCKLQ